MTIEMETRPGGLQRIFVREGRLRSGWRLVIYVVLLIVCVTALSLPPLLVSAMLRLSPWAVQLLAMTAYLGGVLLATWLARRFLDKRSLLDLGLRRPDGWWAEVLFGVALGGMLMLGIFALETGLGWAQVTGLAWQQAGLLNTAMMTVLAAWLFVVVAVNEELMTRGYLLQTLAEGLNLRWAVLISSLIFGLLHLGNPNASWISTFNIGVAGVFLALGYVVTRRLWLPMGLHFGWNFFQGTVFGFPVSGTHSFTLVRLNDTGPSLVTGGAFGPEAGLTGLVAMLLGMLLIVAWARWRIRPAASDPPQA